MDCHTNGVGMDFGHGHVYHSDVFECRVCKKKVAVTAPIYVYDPEYTSCDSYVKVLEHHLNPPDTYAPKEKWFVQPPDPETLLLVRNDAELELRLLRKLVGEDYNTFCEGLYADAGGPPSHEDYIKALQQWADDLTFDEETPE
jgi:hypothetical protein